ncbi:hypothetical protein MRX96_050204 [Rhipicephalus microplus]
MEPGRTDEETAEEVEVPECARRHVQVSPIPKNVNPEYNWERRAARARACTPETTVPYTWTRQSIWTVGELSVRSPARQKWRQIFGHEWRIGPRK